MIANEAIYPMLIATFSTVVQIYNLKIREIVTMTNSIDANLKKK